MRKNKSTLMHTSCKFCGDGRMMYDKELSFADYATPDSFVLEDMDNIIDGMINCYLVYVCDSCGSIEKLTYKEVERRERKVISQMVMDLVARGELHTELKRPKPKVLIYCGKCSGIDGKGGCLLQVYKECKLKKIPNEL